jgi:hypothetical protein
MELLTPYRISSLKELEPYTRLYGTVSFPLATTNERLRSYEIFDSHLERIPGSHLIIKPRPLVNLFSIHLMAMLPTIGLIHERQEKQLVGRDAYLDWMMAKWNSDLDSLESRQLLEISDRVLGLNVEEPWGESHSLAWACIHNLSCRLLFLLLSGQTILQALHSNECLNITGKLVSVIRISQHVILDKESKFVARSCLFLGGLGFPTSAFPKSKKPKCRIMLTMVAVSAWILEYLRSGDHEHDEDNEDGDGNGKEEAGQRDELHLAERLTEFWRTSDVRLMARVLLRLNRYCYL